MIYIFYMAPVVKLFDKKGKILSSCKSTDSFCVKVVKIWVALKHLEYNTTSGSLDIIINSDL